MPKDLCGSLGQCLKMLLHIREQHFQALYTLAGPAEPSDSVSGSPQWACLHTVDVAL